MHTYIYTYTQPYACADVFRMVQKKYAKVKLVTDSVKNIYKDNNSNNSEDDHDLKDIYEGNNRKNGDEDHDLKDIYEGKISNRLFEDIHEGKISNTRYDDHDLKDIYEGKISKRSIRRYIRR